MIPKLAIVSPCYNEELVLDSSIVKFTNLFDNLILRQIIAEDSIIIFVNDGSRDTTWEIIEQNHKTNKYICGIDLTSNVGHQKALLAGLVTAKDMADIVVSIDADIQDDLNAIEKMIVEYNNGYDIVFGVKKSRKGDSFVKRATAVLFYKAQSAMGVKSIYNHADFRLMSKKTLVHLSLYSEVNIYLRGIIAGMGFKSTCVDDYISEREAGESKYNLSKMINLAIDGITSFSVRPLRFVTLTGILTFLVALVAIGDTLYSWITGNVVAGWTSIMASIWLLGSLTLIALGIIGEYVGKIYEETKRRPLYSIDKILIKK